MCDHGHRAVCDGYLVVEVEAVVGVDAEKQCRWVLGHRVVPMEKPHRALAKTDIPVGTEAERTDVGGEPGFVAITI